MFLLPESLPPEHREQFQWSVFNSVKQLSILTRSSIFIRLATVIFLGAVLGGRAAVALPHKGCDASHSQGSMHAKRLLAHLGRRNPAVLERLVAAYLP